MFILDSLMIAGLRWVLDTARTAAESEMNDDSVLREQLLEAELRREMGEIDDEEFRATEADLLARIREIKERREGTGTLTLGARPLEAEEGSTFTVEAELSGDFHAPADTAAVRPGVDRQQAAGSGGGRRRRTAAARAPGRSVPAKKGTATTARRRTRSKVTRTGRE